MATERDHREVTIRRAHWRNAKTGTTESWNTTTAAEPLLRMQAAFRGKVVRPGSGYHVATGPRKNWAALVDDRGEVVYEVTIDDDVRTAERHSTAGRSRRKGRVATRAQRRAGRR